MKKKSKISNFGYLALFGVGFTIFIFVGICWQSKFSLDAWNITEGEIVLFEIQDRSDSNNYGISPSFVPVVKYKYSVNYKEYESERLSQLFLNYSSRFFAEAEVGKYRAGDQVKVYYNPSNPQESILIKTEPNKLGLGLLLLLGMVLIMLGILHVLVKIGVIK